jgi:hypothetical protein
MKKIYQLFGAIMAVSVITIVVVFQTLANQKVPGSFTTTGEKSVPIITNLGIYNSAGQKVNANGGTVTPNTRHSIRFTVSNREFAFVSLSIRLAFFESAQDANFRESFNLARTTTTGDWEDTHFNDTLHKIAFLPTDITYNFEVYFNMSKVASYYDDFYVGALVTQNTGTEDVEAFEVAGFYQVAAYTEFSLDTTNLSIDWNLEDDETFSDFDGESESSKQQIDGTLFKVITNIDVELEIYADTLWRGQDLNEPNNPDAIVEATLVDRSPAFAQEFAVYFTDGQAARRNVSGNAKVWASLGQSSEAGLNAPDLFLYLSVFAENFKNGNYEGSFYFNAVQN